MMRKLSLICALCCCIAASAIVPTPGPAQSKPILIKGGTFHLGNGQTLENGALAFEAGKITFIGAMDSAPTGDFQVIDGTGKHIYPGFIAAANRIGLTEVGAVKAMRDSNETGRMNPNVRSISAYNVDSEYIPATRFNGVLLAQSTPAGSAVNGLSSIVQLDAWTWEDAAVSLDDGLHLDWPNAVSSSFDFSTFTRVRKPNKNYDQTMQSMRDLFQQAKAYANKTDDTPTNLKLAALVPLFKGERTLFIHTASAKSMVNAVAFCKEMGIAKRVIVGGNEAHLISDFLVENKVPVLLDNIHRLPETAADPLQDPFEWPTRLHQAGVLVGLYEGGPMNARNLGFLAGTAAAHGLSKAEALQLITLNVAKILGIEAQFGSLEQGKSATLFISSGDALDMRSQNLEQAFIQGRKIELEGMQQQLFNKYQNR